jgi:elongation factor G
VKAYAPSDHRNIALIGHGGAGKTTLAEALLFRVKAVSRMGSVTEGTSILDYLPEEHQRKASVALAVASLEHADRKINLIDTPGFLDFEAEVSAGLYAAESAMLVVSADAGIEVGSELTWKKSRARRMPAVIVVNGMDREQADGQAALASIKEHIGPRAVALEIPMGSGESFNGLIDVLHNQAVTFSGPGAGKKGAVPPEYEDQVAEARAALMENAAESGEELLNKYLEEGTLSQEDLVAGLHAGVAQGDLYPVLFVSATTGHGVGGVLDVIAEILPGPGDSGAAEGVHPESEEPETRAADVSGPLAAIVFRTAAEAHVGELFFVRVLSGKLASGAEVFNATRDRAEKISQLFHVVGKNRLDTGELSAGDIGVAVKLRNTATNDTLCDRSAPIKLKPIPFPSPVIDFAIRPTGSGDEDKMGTGLARLAAEDPTFRFHYDEETHETIVSGMGETHVDLAIKRLKERFGVDVTLSAPRIPYRETIRGKSSVSYRHKKQTGGRGQFAEVHIRFESIASGEGFVFEDEIVGGAIPGRFIPAVEKGLREALPAGPVAGYPMVDFKAVLFDGKFHDVDSSEAAFKIAASQAFKQGTSEAQPTILEPYWHVRVVVPKDYMGDVMGDLSSRRGKILGMEAEGDDQIINAHVPAGELQRYAVDLRSLTQGRATFTRTFAHYEELARDLQAKVIAESQAQQAELAKR